MPLYPGYSSSKDALGNYIKLRLIKLRMGFLMAITGGGGAKMGTGKSWTAIKIAENVDPLFTIDDVCFRPSEFLKRLDAIEAAGIPGRVLILDESELAAPNTSWQSVANETLAHSLMTSRNLRCMIIIVSPTFGFVDKRIRVLCDVWAHPTRELTGSNSFQVKLYVNKIQTDLVGEKIYFHRLRFYDKNLKKIVIAMGYIVGKPSKALTDAYEEKANQFKHDSRKELYKRALEAENKQLDKSVPRASFKEKIDLIMDNPNIKQELEATRKVRPSQILYEYPDIGITYAKEFASIINNQFGKKNYGKSIPKE
jgi:hypothetical protein